MTAPVLWRWPELCAACELPSVPGPDVTGVSIDTRTLQTGDLFIALAGDPGPRFHSSGKGGADGHGFISRAIEAGAAGLMVSKSVAAHVPCLGVTDTLDGLWTLGQAARKRTGARIAAVTGSSGKTTARQWLQQLLTAERLTHASTGSLNNHWGVPLSLARMPPETAYGVFEVGTNNPGEIAPLSAMVQPHVALVLNVVPAHLGRFADLDAIRREKLSIADGLVVDGVLVLPHDLAHPEVKGRKVLTFGLDQVADVRGVRHPDGRSMQVHIGSDHWHLDLPSTGEHHAATALAVFAVLHALGADLDAACSRTATLTMPQGRGNLHEAGTVTIIDDSYNANPVSMQYALRSIGTWQGQRVAILGEMLELGESSPSLHAAIMPACAGLDGIVTVGEAWQHCTHVLGARHWRHFDSAADVDLAWLSGRTKPGARVLVKGANKIFWANGFVTRLAAAFENG
jgi:UDP-N-acetylmuramoyl-tripeptide--D-alanyl-D-alanine ligase